MWPPTCPGSPSLRPMTSNLHLGPSQTSSFSPPPSQHFSTVPGPRTQQTPPNGPQTARPAAPTPTLSACTKGPVRAEATAQVDAEVFSKPWRPEGRCVRTPRHGGLYGHAMMGDGFLGWSDHGGAVPFLSFFRGERGPWSSGTIFNHHEHPELTSVPIKTRRESWKPHPPAPSTRSESRSGALANRPPNRPGRTKICST